MKLLMIGILFIFSGFTEKPDPCEGVKLELSAHDTTNGQKNGRIEIEFEDAKEQVRFFLFGDRPSKNRRDFKEEEIDNLASGTYYVIAQDGSGCTMFEKVIIK